MPPAASTCCVGSRTGYMDIRLVVHLLLSISQLVSFVKCTNVLPNDSKRRWTSL
ncbi:hypothetical protein LIPSTDRAFT_324152 [Lipomyces starkeyi NRRL Y-11557]|uniref:Uncharacterized protein n=1 Tax=Lipomyces starkeyi NRRL Y-11557 TaxID=675824 RepID=A0A1E3Q1D0_LIPST|nr:hypothetical protein LIPSTDRAFT_324152 [Lipomyces starkeyi NRRL Y-11557]